MCNHMIGIARTSAEFYFGLGLIFYTYYKIYPRLKQGVRSALQHASAFFFWKDSRVSHYKVASTSTIT